MTNIPRDVPVCWQVATVLRARIVNGEYRSMLPSERDLSMEFGVGRDTVRDALAVLSGEGLVGRRPGCRSRSGAVGARVAAERQIVAVSPGVCVSARMPTPREVAEQEIPAGVPVLVAGDQVLRADLFVLVFG